MKSLWRLNQLIVFEISKNLNLKDKIKLSGVCKELQRKLYYQNASGEYICLKTPGIEKIVFETIKNRFLENKVFKKVVSIILVKSISEINIRNNKGDTLLISAAYYGNTEMVESFLNTHCQRVDINIQDYTGATALIWAAAHGHKEIVKLLLDTKRADIDIQDFDGDTALSAAASNGHEDIFIFSLLLKYGANVNIQNKYGNTALIWAAINCQSDIISLLLKNGANADIKNKKGSTALFFATHRGKTEIIEMIKSAKKI